MSAFPPINPVTRLRPPPFESPNAALEGYRQRIVSERQHAAAVGPSTRRAPPDPAVAKFLGDFRQVSRYGNHASAAAGKLHSALPLPVKALTTGHIDTVLPPLPKNYGRNKNYFYTKDTVASAMYDYNEEVDREAGRQRIKKLKSQIRSERRALRALESSAEGQGVPLDAALPRDWFETRDANGETCWMHRITQHTSMVRPTAATPIAPMHMALKAAVDLPTGWFETRDVQGRTVWRHVESMEVSRTRPTGPPSMKNKVYIPGRDAARPSYMEGFEATRPPPKLKKF